MKILLIFFVFNFYSFSLFAQKSKKISLEISLNKRSELFLFNRGNSYIKNISNNLNYFSELSIIPSIYIEYSNYEKLKLKIGVNFHNRVIGIYYYHNTFPLTADGIRALYLNFPIATSYKIYESKKFAYYNSFGIVPIFYTKSYSEYSTIDEKLIYNQYVGVAHENKNVRKKINRTLFDIYFGLPIEFFPQKRFNLILEPSIQYGLINLVKDTKRSNILSFELKLGLKIH